MNAGLETFKALRTDLKLGSAFTYLFYYIQHSYIFKDYIYGLLLFILKCNLL